MRPTLLLGLMGVTALALTLLIASGYGSAQAGSSIEKSSLSLEFPAQPTPPSQPPDPEAPVMQGYPGAPLEDPLTAEMRVGAAVGQPRATGTGPEKVIGGDGHVAVGAANTAAPYRWVARLLATFPDGPDGGIAPDVYECTGFLIGPTTVITAGHCVYRRSTADWATQVSVAPAKAGAAEPYGFQMGVKLSATFGYIATVNPLVAPCFDYGAVMVGSPFPGMVGPFFPFGNVLAQGQTARLSGYPFTGHAHDADGQFRHDEVITGFTCSGNELTSYEIDTCGAQSGSPVWYVNDPAFTVGAVHTYGHELADAACGDLAGGTPCIAGDNCGRRVDAAAAVNFNYWLQISPSFVGVGGVTELPDISTLPQEPVSTPAGAFPVAAAALVGGLLTVALAAAGGTTYMLKRRRR